MLKMLQIFIKDLKSTAIRERKSRNKSWRKFQHNSKRSRNGWNRNNYSKTVETVIKGIKNQKAGDRFGWKAEWIKSLEAIYNKIEKEKKTPAQCRYTITKQ